jgi:4-azaleucine resistance transporter AzlC
MKTYRFALKQIVPILMSYIFVGLACGLLFYKAGYGVFWAAAAALFVYAGSMQIVLVTLMSAGMSVWMVGAMTLFINARHIFYGIGFIEKFKKIGGWKYPYMVLTLTDETYSVLCSLKCPEGIDEGQVMFDIQITCHLLWILSCAAGALIGEVLPFDAAGIEFSATAFFTAIVVNQWQESRSHIPAVAGFVSAVVFWALLGADNFILPALSVSVIALSLLRRPIEEKNGGGVHV